MTVNYNCRFNFPTKQPPTYPCCYDPFIRLDYPCWNDWLNHPTLKKFVQCCKSGLKSLPKRATHWRVTIELQHHNVCTITQYSEEKFQHYKNSLSESGWLDYRRALHVTHLFLQKHNPHLHSLVPRLGETKIKSKFTKSNLGETKIAKSKPNLGETKIAKFKNKLSESKLGESKTNLTKTNLGETKTNLTKTKLIKTNLGESKSNLTKSNLSETKTKLIKSNLDETTVRILRNGKTIRFDS